MSSPGVDTAPGRRDEPRMETAPSIAPRPLSPIEIAAHAADSRPVQSRIDTATRIPMLGGVRASSPQAASETGSVAVAEPGLFLGQLDGQLEDQPELEARVDDPLEGYAALHAHAASDTAIEGATGAPEADPLASLRDNICAALEAKGHNTAAALLSAGEWTETADTIRAAVNVKRTMLSLTMNAEAEKICKAVIAASGSTQRFTVVSADGASTADLANKPANNGNGKPPTTGGRTARPAPGSIQAEALAHPLVKQAQELFSAEVRHVLDLRKT